MWSCLNCSRISQTGNKVGFFLLDFNQQLHMIKKNPVHLRNSKAIYKLYPEGYQFMYVFCFYFFVLLQTKTVILEKQINIKLFYPNEIRDYTWTTVLSEHFVSKIGITNITPRYITTTKLLLGLETDKVGISRLSHHLEDLKDEALRQRSLLKRAPFRKRNGISNCASNKTGRLGQHSTALRGAAARGR